MRIMRWVVVMLVSMIISGEVLLMIWVVWMVPGITRRVGMMMTVMGIMELIIIWSVMAPVVMHGLTPMLVWIEPRIGWG